VILAIQEWGWCVMSRLSTKAGRLIEDESVGGEVGEGRLVVTTFMIKTRHLPAAHRVYSLVL